MHHKQEGVFGILDHWQNKVERVISEKDCNAVLSLTSKHLTADILYGKYPINF